MLRSSRPTVTTRGMSFGSAPKMVGRPCVSALVVTRPRGLWNRNSRVRSRCGSGLPSTAMLSFAPTLSAGDRITAPLTATRPASIQASASRREASPARAITLAMRSASLRSGAAHRPPAAATGSAAACCGISGRGAGMVAFSIIGSCHARLYAGHPRPYTRGKQNRRAMPSYMDMALDEARKAQARGRGAGRLRDRA